MRHKLVVCGAAGRMGRRIIAMSVGDGSFEVIGAVEKRIHPEMGKDAGLVAGISELKIPIADIPAPDADVVIDFSTPQAVDATIDYCLQTGAALVLGTTGLSENQHDKLADAAGKIPVICTTNMSVGMNVLFNLVGKVATLLGPDYDVELIEQHHRFKKDAPSGSALTLAKNICRATDRPFPDSLKHGRSGKEAARQQGAIGMHSVRAGDIAGIHSVIFSTLGETVTLSHTAHSRDTFARGALLAAKWLAGKKPGQYSIADVLGLQ